MKTNSSSNTSWTITHRPKSISDLHQKSVKDQLLQYQSTGYFPQVLLFAGPKGTGKTTSARIIGAILNDPKNAELVSSNYFNSPKHSSLNNPDDSNHTVASILEGSSFVVRELDAASNRGINEIRELKDQSQVGPIGGLISVYILDEAHMLTTPAFNALLKLLEEPPRHAVFILATTELHKIPETVVSRCQVVHFKKASKTELFEALSSVAKKEGISVSNEVLQKLSELSNGSFRDAVKYLQKISSFPEPTLDLVNEVIIPSFSQTIASILSALINKDAKMICELFLDLRQSVSDEKLFLAQFMQTIHQDLLLGILPSESVKATRSQQINLFLLREFSIVSSQLPSAIPHLALEITCLSIIERSNQKNPTKKKSPTPTLPIQKKTGSNNPSSTLNSASSTQHVRGEAQKILDNWSQFLTLIARQNTTLAAIFRSAKPGTADKHILNLDVYYQFHKDQLLSVKYHQIIQSTIELIANGAIEFSISVIRPPDTAELVDQVPATLSDQVASILLQTDPQDLHNVVQSDN